MSKRYERDIVTISRLLGEQLVEIHRIVYTYEGEVDDEDGGDIEFLSQSGVFVRFSDEQGGQILAVSERPWCDELSDEENSDFVGDFGKWTRLEVTEAPPYSRLVSQRITGIVAYGRGGQLGAVELEIGSETVAVVAAADECRVYFSSIREESEQFYLDSVKKMSVDSN